MIKIGFDDNLGLPKHFASEISCEVIPYHDLAEVLSEFKKHHLTAAFIPAGTLPYLDFEYQIIAQSVLNSKQKLSTLLVSANETTFTQLMNKTLGRVNPYCTTSFWAPMIYFMSQFPIHTLLHFVDTNSFEDMLQKTVSGEIDYAMIWKAVLDKYPVSAKKLHVLAQYNEIPTPIIIGQKELPQDFINRLQSFKSSDPHTYFNEFTIPDMVSIETFKQHMIKAKTYFSIRVC